MDFVLDKTGFVNTIYIRIRLYGQSNLYIHKEGVIMPETQRPQISTMMTRMDINLLTEKIWIQCNCSRQ